MSNKECQVICKEKLAEITIGRSLAHAERVQYSNTREEKRKHVRAALGNLRRSLFLTQEV